MTRTAWSVTGPLTRVPSPGPQADNGAYGGRIWAHAHNWIVSGTENLRCVGSSVSHPHLSPHAAPLLDVVHNHDYFQLSHPSSTLHHGEFSPPLQVTHPSYSLLPTESEFIGNTPAASRNLDFSQPSDLHNLWGLFPPSLDLLPHATDVSPPTLHHFALDPTLRPNSPCLRLPWSAEGIRSGSTDEVPQTSSIHDLPDFQLPNSGPSSYPNLDNTSEPCSGTLGASHPCQWSKGGVICNVMVQASRSHMNRHLHAYHGFGGSDARPTKCYWAGCGATMQQGSIARHMVTCHLQAKVTCPMCSKKLSRQDVISKHQRVCPAAGTWR